MASNWKECKLGEITDILGDGLHGTPIYTENGEYAFVNGNNLVNGHIEVKTDTKRVSESEFIKYKKPLSDRTLLVSINGTLGNIAEYNNEKIILGKSACYFNLKNNVSKSFIKYVLLSKTFQNYLENNATGTTIKNISLKQMREYKFLLPPLETQQKIAKVLGTIDDKIELNNSINNNLEQQAQAIFKSWFVDFEPFGGTMPDDWKSLTLGDVTENIRTRIGKNNYIVLSAVNTGKLQPSDEFFSKQVYSKNTEKYIKVDEGNFSYNPARINIGSIGINDLGYTGCVSPVYVAFSVEHHYESFFRFYFKSSIFKEETRTRASGSVRQSLNYTDFALIEINYPSTDIARKFNEIYNTFFKVKNAIEKENKSLTQLRDTLLPKLMSGEIDVSGVNIEEKIISTQL